MKNAKYFKPTNWSIDNKTSIYILTVILGIMGILSYNSLPKEQFPDIVIPTITVQTIYPGTSPADMENLVTRHIEKQIKPISGIKTTRSYSFQDFSVITVEFNTGVEVSEAKQKVKDAVDKAKQDLPTDLPSDPIVNDVNFSDFPMMNINISGNYDLSTLKKYADELKDKIEELPEITRVDMIGALDREVQVDVDMYKMQAARITMSDIDRAIASQNVLISGGVVPMGNMKRTLKVNGQFNNIDQIKNIIVSSVPGSMIYLRDVANVTDGYKEKESYARLDGKNVITLNVVKRSGQNLINASDKTRGIIASLQKSSFPPDLSFVITGDQSTATRNTLTDLINSIIIGFVLVTLVLMFFMGVTNALFVGLSVPLSIFIGFLVMPSIGFNLNMIVLFSLLFALGIIVDDAIVVIENTHRIFHNNKMGIGQSAKIAAGEVFVPVFAGTLTTLAPFLPLAFWPGIIGKFMFYLPITLIITLLASLVAAFIFNPVYATTFMNREKHPHTLTEDEIRRKKKSFRNTVIIFLVIAALFYVSSSFGMGNFTIFMLLSVLFNKFVLTGMIKKFQARFIPALQRTYEKMITWALRGKHPYFLLGGTFILLFLSPIFVGMRSPDVVFFPSGEPNFVYAYIKLPVGTDVAYTDSITKVVEGKVFEVVGKNNPVVDAVISNVAVGAGDPMEGGGLIEPNKGKVTVAFKEYKYRDGVSTQDYLDQIRDKLKGMVGVEISVDKEQNGPPTGKPINIEVSGDNLTDLIRTSDNLKRYLDSLKIDGVEGLKSSVDVTNPEIKIDVNPEKVQQYGLSTAQVGMEIRNAVYGKEVSKYKDLEDEFPIMLRYQPEQRRDIDGLMNLNLTFRDMNTGMIKQVPLSAIAKASYETSVGSIIRINMKRVVTLSSNVLTGYTPTAVNAVIIEKIANYNLPNGIQVKLTGESEDQAETSNFLGTAMMVSLGLILLILVTQFNSISKPIIILSEIIFSVIGVLLGIAIFDMSFVIVMTGMGIVGLAGIVVKNGILLVEFTDELKKRGFKTKDAIIEAGKIRMIPVLLTASATILGLVPLAVGFNINFQTLFTELNPHIYLGGDNVIFWGPLSWTIIFGLSFATFLTLILVPSMYYISHTMKIWWKRKLNRWFGWNLNKKEEVNNDIIEL